MKREMVVCFLPFLCLIHGYCSSFLSPVFFHRLLRRPRSRIPSSSRLCSVILKTAKGKAIVCIRIFSFCRRRQSHHLLSEAIYLIRSASHQHTDLEHTVWWLTSCEGLTD
jgi:hypothetical protein